MIEDSSCPICRQFSWHILRTCHYDLRQQHDEYLSKRIRVLFEIWFPHESGVSLRFCICTSCGFATHLPRVEETDIDAKYRFLESLGQDYGKSENLQVRKDRSHRLLHHCRKFLSENSDILDYGGGDGRLMSAFLDVGHRCHVIDYNGNTIPGVNRLGATIDEVRQNEKLRQFDLIVCNHVIEHVGDPVRTISDLAQLLKPMGTLLIEVPMEIWRRPPSAIDPVTHVNFFVPLSLRRTIEEAGLHVINCCLTTYRHPDGRLLPAVLATAQNRGIIPAKSSGGYRQVQGYLNPGLKDRIYRAWALRESVPDIIRHKLRRFIR